jgi:hypothetical protein
MSLQEQTLKLNKDKKHLTYSIGDFYEKYSQDRKDIDHLSRKQYIRIIKRLFKLIALDIIKTTVPFNPKVGLGRFGIVKRSNSRKGINWKLTKKLGKKIYYTNAHTNGNYFRWHWEKGPKCYFNNKKFYSFSVVRSLKKELSNYIMQREKDPTLKPYDALSQLPPYEN